jgi:hypothetical protein
MKPAADIVLSTLVEDMGKKLAFVPPGNERMMMMGMKVMLGIVARNADDAAAMRLAEINELSALLRRSAACCPLALADLLLGVARSAESAREDIRISSLDRVLDELRGCLIELQTWAETSSHPEAKALLAQCWDFLVRANDKRVVFDKPW